MHLFSKHTGLVITIILCLSDLSAQNNYTYTLSSQIITSTGDYSPFFFHSNMHGTLSNKTNNGILRASLIRNANAIKKLNWGAGVDLISGYGQNAPFWIQQLYGELQFKNWNLSIGNKEYESDFINRNLSSGSLIWSGNSRPIPQIRLQLSEFTSVPGTHEWLQIKGSVSYGKFTDSDWLKDHYNYQNSFITTNVWYHQKSLYFRSKESNPFVLTLGGEFACQFGGDMKTYLQGKQLNSLEVKPTFKDFLKVLIPRSGGSNTAVGDQAYYYGNHLGAWHILGAYQFKDKSQLKGYVEWLFEDGSGIGKLNGWDGLWGISYNTHHFSLISGAVLEYLQTTNQSGPIHWAPNDFPNTELTNEATGSDDYYNNYFYNGWTQYGNTIGTPLLKGTAYNKDGYLRLTNTRIKAFHFAFEGYLSPQLHYTFKNCFSKGWGTPFAPIYPTQKNYSASLKIDYSPRRLPGCLFSIQTALDRGSYWGDNTGIMFCFSKKGLFSY